jgi:hypothetical protein
MGPQEIRNLQEAYLEVYVPQENIEEGLRSAVKRLLGGGKKEAESSKPESRGEQLRKKYNVGPEKSDTSAKRQILDRSRAKAEKDEKDYGDKPFQKQVANQSKAAHDRYLKAGYSKYGADDARGRGSKAAKRAASLNREEFEYIVDTLIEEGYDLSNYTWDEMYDVCLDEICQLDELSVGKMLDYVKKGEKNRADLNKKWDQGKASYREKMRVLGREEGESRASDKVEKKTGKRPYQMNALDKARYAVTKEEVDLYDIILSHLLDEGFASTEQSADKIILNMSESWFEEILNERTRFAKETGKNVRTGRPSVEGGDPKVAERNKLPGYKYGGSKQEPKERGKKPPSPSEEAKKKGVLSPLEHKVALRRNARQRASDFRMDTRGT